MGRVAGERSAVLCVCVCVVSMSVSVFSSVLSCFGESCRGAERCASLCVCVCVSVSVSLCVLWSRALTTSLTLKHEHKYTDQTLPPFLLQCVCVRVREWVSMSVHACVSACVRMCLRCVCACMCLRECDDTRDAGAAGGPPLAGAGAYSGGRVR